MITIYISTGIAVVGSVGSATRSQYTLFGSVVNLAARLMYLAHTSTANQQINHPPPSISPSPSPSPSLNSDSSITPSVSPAPTLSPVNSFSPPKSGPVLSPSKKELTVEIPTTTATRSPSSPNIPKIAIHTISNSSSPHTPLSARGTVLDAPFASIDMQGRPHSAGEVGKVGSFEKNNGERSESMQSSRSSDNRKGTSFFTNLTANTILCDEETYHLARSRFYFLPLDPVSFF